MVDQKKRIMEAIQELIGQIKIQQEGKKEIGEDRDAERSTEQKEKNEGRSNGRKYRREMWR